MWKAQSILVALICASPAILLGDGLIVQGLLAGVVAVALAVTAATLRPGETEFLVSVIRPAAAIAVVPVLWVLFQLLPLRALAHPVWASAESALGHTVTGAVSVDKAASVIGLGQYLVLCAVALLCAAVGVDRGRAESLLFALTAAGALIALMALTHHFLLAPAPFSPFPREQATDCIAMGTVIAGAACIRTIERYLIRRGRPQRSASTLISTFTACSVALAVCAAALFVVGTPEVLVATGGGLAILACVMVIRRSGLGSWGLIAFAAPLIAAALLVFTSHPATPGRSLLLAFSRSQTGVSERALEDAPLLGTGAGTFAAVAPIYRQMRDPPTGAGASTTVATLAIELGRPMLWLIVTAAVGIVLLLLRASLQRGRDSFYPAMGAGCLITLPLLSFINNGLLGIAPGLIAAAVLGVAIAQSKSRSLPV